VRVVVLTVGLLAVMGLVTGCSSKCESICAEANACSVKERATDVDCTHFCADAEDINERAKKAGSESCATQFEAHLSCWEKNTKQICSTDFTGCAESGEAWIACMTPYCEANAEAAKDDPKKADPNCDGGEPTLVYF
jgi:hypothetical protein